MRDEAVAMADACGAVLEDGLFHVGAVRGLPGVQCDGQAQPPRLGQRLAVRLEERRERDAEELARREGGGGGVALGREKWRERCGPTSKLYPIS